MRILTVTATEFGLFKNKRFIFDGGLTLITGANESGKSTLQALVTFLLYGFPARDQAERSLRLSRDGKRAVGEMTLCWRDSTYRIRRTYLLRSLSGRTAPLEECVVTDAADCPVDLNGKQPGEYFLGLPREMYEATVLSRQSEIDAVTSPATGDAVSNLLFLDSGGGGLETAVRLLDAARRALTHNRGRGGLLYTLAEERTVIEADLQKAREHHGALHSLRARAAALTADLQDKEHALSALTDSARAGELDTHLARFTALHEAEAEEARLEKSLQAWSEVHTRAPRADAEMLAAISKGVSLWEGLLAERAQALVRAENARSAHTAITENSLYAKIESLGDAEMLKDKLRHLDNNATRLAVFFTVLCVAGAGALSLLFTPFPKKHLVYTAVGTLLVGALASLIGRWRARKKRRAICRTLGIRTKGLLSTILTTHLENKDRAAIAAQTESEQRNLAATLTAKILSAEKELASTATALGIPDDTPPHNLLARALSLTAEDKSTLAEGSALQTALATARAKREMLAAALCNLNEAALRSERQTLAGIHPLSPDEAVRHRTFLEEAKTDISAKLLAVAREEATFAAKETDISTLESALAENKIRTKEAADRLAAIRLAQQAIAEANDTLQSDLLPRIADEASDILKILTDGRYDRLCLNADFAVSLQTDNCIYPLSTFSAGCRDAAGLSLRLALTRVITSEPLPLLFDEVTARLDGERTQNLLTHLSRLAEGGTQILLFTCHSREEKMLAADGKAYTKISLSTQSDCHS